MPFVIALLLWFALLQTPTPAPGPEISLLTYNTHMEKIETEPVLGVLRAAQADIVAMQEAHYEIMPLIRTVLSTLYPYQTDVTFGDLNRTLLLSRYPLLEVQRWPGHEFELMRALVDIDGQPVVVYNVHPTSPGNTGYSRDVRSGQIDILLEAAAHETHPVILMGDFNMEEWSADYRRIAETYVDAFRTLYPVEEDPGFTYPDYSTPQSRRNARLPAFTPLILRLDYVFHSADFEVVAAQVWPESGGSDHRPVYAVLRLPAPAD
jgi:vancomycin resistance protein VanJ